MLGYNRVLPSIFNPQSIKAYSLLHRRVTQTPMFYFSEEAERHSNRKFKIVEDPKEVNKLIFDANGKCRVFEHKEGQKQMKWIMRVGTLVTVMNSFLMGAQMVLPMFGAWNMFSFSTCAGLGFLLLGTFHVLAKRTIHQIYLHNNLENVDVVFFNPFWKPQTITFHVSEFQDLQDSRFGFIRVELTSIGKTWIKISKNEFRNVKDYEQTLDCILLGKPITNLKTNIKSKMGK